MFLHPPVPVFSILPIRVRDKYFEVERSRHGLIAHRSRREAILRYGGEDTGIYGCAGRLKNFQVIGLAGLIHHHADNDSGFAVEYAR